MIFPSLLSSAFKKFEQKTNTLKIFQLAIQNIFVWILIIMINTINQSINGFIISIDLSLKIYEKDKFDFVTLKISSKQSRVGLAVLLIRKFLKNFYNPG
jgi:hypothetical protein